MAKRSTAIDIAGADRSSDPGGLREKDVEALRRRLMSYAVKFLWNRHDAEEIVQDAFKEAVKIGLTFSRERSLPWMLRTVGNLCRNLRRRRRPEALTAWSEPSTNSTPEGRMRQADDLEQLRTALEHLPERQRTALILRAMEQMDYAGVAEIMELSISAVRTHVHLARQRLAELLEE